ncbi:MAG: hypothetical protein JWN90_688 [Parcubacteria group bacterium]|nr:hypothetical protein [Parcubacteria group bacterium]
MSRESILMILGILIAISPWSGLPLSILAWILPLLGLATAFIGFTLRTRATNALRSTTNDTSSRPSQELY